ncbi:MAG: adenylate cyclase [Proteobacteria bacterium SG_bin9]|nr:MAG: adenylate cyclase [Proteobacteria bacterium SG_bin9]
MASADASIGQFWKQIGVRQVQLGSGLILFAYVVSHLFNHALGNVSIRTMDEFLLYQIAFWRSWPLTIVLYGAVFTHMALGLWSVYRRREFRWRFAEPLQLALGLSIPLLLMFHISGVRIAAALYGHEKLYPQALYAYYVYWPHLAALHYVALIVCWLHGCMGVFFWLRLKPVFPKIAAYLLAAAVLLPSLALLGLYQGGREVTVASETVEWRAEHRTVAKTGTQAQQDVLDKITLYFCIGYLAVIAGLLAARGARALREQRGSTIRFSYGDGKTIRVQKGLSVLEASLRNDIPHSSVCGGRARCSTCRIRVVSDCARLPKASKRETFVLERVGSSSDPAIRLACQLCPEHDIAFVPLFPATLKTSLLDEGKETRVGQERYLVNMFVDMRGSTKLAETRLPFDTVFIVNRFISAVSQGVLACGGTPNQFVGDGILALFGLSADPRIACRQAIRAAAQIAINVEELNRFLAHDLREPIRFGIGINAGEVIVGDIGYRDHMSFTALGDPVNVGSRLEGLTKTLSCEVVISEEVYRTAGLPENALPHEEVPIHGRVETMRVRKAVNARDLAALIDDVVPEAA